MVFGPKPMPALVNYNEALADLHKGVEIDPQNPAVYVETSSHVGENRRARAAQADYQVAANLYLERHDLENYQATLAKLQSLQQARPTTP